VDEALRLIEASKQSLMADESRKGRGLNASSKIYNIVKGLADSGACRAEDADDEELGVELSVRKVKERVFAKGFTEDQWLKALDEYTELNVSISWSPSSCFIPLPVQPLCRLFRSLTFLPLGLANCWKRHPSHLCPCQRRRPERRRHVGMIQRLESLLAFVFRALLLDLVMISLSSGRSMSALALEQDKSFVIFQ
jgi:hypothetical protein